MAGKSVQHRMLSDEAKVAAERKKQNNMMTSVTCYTGNTENRYVCLPVVSRMASAERDVLHLEEVTTSVILRCRDRQEERQTVDLNDR